MRSQPRGISAAMLVAVAFLAAALVGTALAGPEVLTRAITKAKVKQIAKRQANRAIDAREGTLSVESAETATVGGPAAYAQIQAGGGVDPAEPSRGISGADVTSPEPGVYCVRLSFPPVTGSGNAVSEGEEDGIVSLELRAPFVDCPDEVEAEVRVVDGAQGIDDPGEDIWVQFDG